MKIKRGATDIADVVLSESSFTNEEINGSFTAYLEFDVLEPLSLTINDRIAYMGEEYYIRYKESVQKKETSVGYSYQITFFHELYRLHDVVFFLYDTPEFKKSTSFYNGNALDVLKLIVKSMNRVHPGWTVGECIESKTQTFNFQNKTCAEVVNDVLNAYNTEYWVKGKKLNFGKREFDSGGLVLKQGEGFKNLTLEAVDDTPPITRLYAYGGDTNLTADYGSYLMLPGKALYIEKNVAKYGVIEYIKQWEDVFPVGEFAVTSKINNTTLRASGIDFNLTAQLIDGIEVLVAFQNGALAGYDLAVVEGSWNNTTKELRLKQNEEEDALKVPGDINFEVGDTFIFTGLKMPDSYITNASQELLETAQKFLDEKCENRVQLKGECDEIEFAEREIHIACGQLVGVQDAKLEINREIRVTAVKRYIENDDETPFRYELIVSDFLQTNGFSQIVDEIKDVPNKIDNEVRPIDGFTKRTWRDVQETKQMMYDPESQFWQDIVSAIVGEFGHLIVGFQSAQMDFIGVRFQPNYNNDPNNFRSTAGRLVHMTINGDGASRTWNISASNLALSNAYAYYVYARCSVSGDAGSIVYSLLPIKVEEEAGYYHFWIGVLNTPENNVRSWKPVYGYTEIAGQQITTGVIQDMLARLIIDLKNARITAKDGAEIIGKIIISAGSSGLGNLEEWEQAAQAIGDALTAAENASNAANTANSNANTAINTANDKAKVFYSPDAPTSGMKTNDLWVDGVLIYRYNGSAWVVADKYDMQMVVSNGGLFTAGAITFGEPGAQTGGMSAYGSIRIWSGGNSGVAGGTFRVMATGDVYSKGSYLTENANGEVNAGITGMGTAAGSVRIWAGAPYDGSANTNSIDNAPFRVTQDGSMYSSKGEMGGFTVAYNSIQSKDNAYPDYGNNSKFYMSSSGDSPFLSFSANGLWAGIGLHVMPAGYPRTLLRLENTAPLFSDGENGNIRIKTTGSSTRNIHIFIADAGEWNTAGKSITIESRKFSNDNAGFFRTCIMLSTMPHESQINTLGSYIKHPVYWDENSGYLFFG
ncbi:MAG: hypothetical protein LBK45_02965 [Tannerellaceae bacterium]|jgi:hypothetical protein|nr:hypothetical protein [Tannerellaceae bacterium]